MKLKYESIVKVLNGGLIEMNLDFVGDYGNGTMGQMRQNLIHQILDVQDRQVRETLIGMGWTPPRDASPIAHEEIQRENDTVVATDQWGDMLNGLADIMKPYADDDNYTKTTRSCEFVSNNVREETFHEFDGTSGPAKRGLDIIEQLKRR